MGTNVEELIIELLNLIKDPTIDGEHTIFTAIQYLEGNGYRLDGIVGDTWIKDY